jgi:hypothetical protein
MPILPFTKGPYIAWDDGRTIGVDSDAPGDDGWPFPVAMLEIVDHGDTVSDANLFLDQTFVCHAMNCHADMLAALERAERDALTYVNELYLKGPRMAGSYSDASSRLSALRATIAKAKGLTP